MKRIVLICILLFLLSPSCNKETGDYEWFRRPETGCADPWHTNSNDSNSEVSKAVSSYLKANSVRADRIFIGYDPDIADVCLSCFCFTGRFVQVFASTEFEEKLAELGFFKVEKQE